MATTLGVGSGQNTNCTSITPVFADVANFKYVRDDPGETIRACIAAGLDQPSKIRLAFSEVANIFANSGIEPTQGTSLKGSSLLCQLTETWKVYDDADATVVPYYLPASAHMVIKFPNHALVTGTVVAALVHRLLGGMYPAAATSLSTVMAPLLRGALKPY